MEKEKPLYIIRYRNNPLRICEVIYFDEIKKGFTFYWSLNAFGFFEISKEVKMKQNLIKGMKGNLQGIWCSSKSKNWNRIFYGLQQEVNQRPGIWIWWKLQVNEKI